jgi:ABC-type sugar transport system substrate-binding protein
VRSMVWKKVVLVLSAALLTPALEGCRPSGGRLQRRDRIVRIVVIGEGIDEPTWGVVEATAAAFARNNPLTHIEARAPRTASPSGQMDLLRALEQEEVDAVCIHPVDPSSLGERIDVLSQRGTPVVLFGRDVRRSQRGYYCGPSDFEIGRKAVEAAAQVLVHRAKSIMLLHARTHDDNQSRRYDGFKQGMTRTAALSVLREVDCRGDQFDSVRLVRMETRRFPRTGCWVFLDDWPLRALPDHEPLLPLGATIILCEGGPQHIARLRNGEIQAMIGYDFHLAVNESLFAALRMVEDRTGGFSPVVDIPPEIITAEKLPEYEARWKAWRQGESTVSRLRNSVRE